MSRAGCAWSITEYASENPLHAAHALLGDFAEYALCSQVSHVEYILTLLQQALLIIWLCGLLFLYASSADLALDILQVLQLLTSVGPGLVTRAP